MGELGRRWGHPAHPRAVCGGRCVVQRRHPATRCCAGGEWRSARDDCERARDDFPRGRQDMGIHRGGADAPGRNDSSTPGRPRLRRRHRVLRRSARLVRGPGLRVCETDGALAPHAEAHSEIVARGVSSLRVQRGVAYLSHGEPLDRIGFDRRGRARVFCLRRKPRFCRSWRHLDDCAGLLPKTARANSSRTRQVGVPVLSSCRPCC